VAQTLDAAAIGQRHKALARDPLNHLVVWRSILLARHDVEENQLIDFLFIKDSDRINWISHISRVPELFRFDKAFATQKQNWD
jgi:hypothetical protein